MAVIVVITTNNINNTIPCLRFNPEEATKVQRGSTLSLTSALDGMVNAATRLIYPWERPGTHWTGGGVGLRAVLDECGKSRPHRTSIPGPSSS